MFSAEGTKSITQRGRHAVEVKKAVFKALESGKSVTSLRTHTVSHIGNSSYFCQVGMQKVPQVFLQ